MSSSSPLSDGGSLLSRPYRTLRQLRRDILLQQQQQRQANENTAHHQPSSFDDSPIDIRYPIPALPPLDAFQPAFDSSPPASLTLTGPGGGDPSLSCRPVVMPSPVQSESSAVSPGAVYLSPVPHIRDEPNDPTMYAAHTQAAHAMQQPGGSSAAATASQANSPRHKEFTNAAASTTLTQPFAIAIKSPPNPIDLSATPHAISSPIGVGAASPTQSHSTLSSTASQHRHMPYERRDDDEGAARAQPANEALESSVTSDLNTTVLADTLRSPLSTTASTIDQQSSHALTHAVQERFDRLFQALHAYGLQRVDALADQVSASLVERAKSTSRTPHTHRRMRPTATVDQSAADEESLIQLHGLRRGRNRREKVLAHGSASNAHRKPRSPSKVMPPRFASPSSSHSYGDFDSTSQAPVFSSFTRTHRPISMSHAPNIAFGSKVPPQPQPQPTRVRSMSRTPSSNRTHSRRSASAAPPQLDQLPYASERKPARRRKSTARSSSSVTSSTLSPRPRHRPLHSASYLTSSHNNDFYIRSKIREQERLAKLERLRRWTEEMEYSGAGSALAHDRGESTARSISLSRSSIRSPIVTSRNRVRSPSVSSVNSAGPRSQSSVRTIRHRSPSQITSPTRNMPLITFGSGAFLPLTRTPPKSPIQHAMPTSASASSLPRPHPADPHSSVDDPSLPGPHRLLSLQPSPPPELSRSLDKTSWLARLEVMEREIEQLARWYAAEQKRREEENNNKTIAATNNAQTHAAGSAPSPSTFGADGRTSGTSRRRSWREADGFGAITVATPPTSHYSLSPSPILAQTTILPSPSSSPLQSGHVHPIASTHEPPSVSNILVEEASIMAELSSTQKRKKNKKRIERPILLVDGHDEHLDHTIIRPNSTPKDSPPHRDIPHPIEQQSNDNTHELTVEYHRTDLVQHPPVDDEEQEGFSREPSSNTRAEESSKQHEPLQFLSHHDGDELTWSQQNDINELKVERHNGSTAKPYKEYHVSASEPSWSTTSNMDVSMVEQPTNTNAIHAIPVEEHQSSIVGPSSSSSLLPVERPGLLQKHFSEEGELRWTEPVDLDELMVDTTHAVDTNSTLAHNHRTISVLPLSASDGGVAVWSDNHMAAPNRATTPPTTTIRMSPAPNHNAVQIPSMQSAFIKKGGSSPSSIVTPSASPRHHAGTPHAPSSDTPNSSSGPVPNSAHISSAILPLVHQPTVREFVLSEVELGSSSMGESELGHRRRLSGSHASTIFVANAAEEHDTHGSSVLVDHALVLAPSNNDAGPSVTAVLNERMFHIPVATDVDIDEHSAMVVSPGGSTTGTAHKSHVVTQVESNGTTYDSSDVTEEWAVDPNHAAAARDAPTQEEGEPAPTSVEYAFDHLHAVGSDDGDTSASASASAVDPSSSSVLASSTLPYSKKQHATRRHHQRTITHEQAPLFQHSLAIASQKEDEEKAAGQIQVLIETPAETPNGHRRLKSAVEEEGQTTTGGGLLLSYVPVVSRNSGSSALAHSNRSSVLSDSIIVVGDGRSTGAHSTMHDTDAKEESPVTSNMVDHGDFVRRHDELLRALEETFTSRLDAATAVLTATIAANMSTAASAAQESWQRQAEMTLKSRQDELYELRRSIESHLAEQRAELAEADRRARERLQVERAEFEEALKHADARRATFEQQRNAEQEKLQATMLAQLSAIDQAAAAASAERARQARVDLEQLSEHESAIRAKLSADSIRLAADESQLRATIADETTRLMEQEAEMKVTLATATSKLAEQEATLRSTLASESSKLADAHMSSLNDLNELRLKNLSDLNRQTESSLDHLASERQKFFDATREASEKLSHERASIDAYQHDGREQLRSEREALEQQRTALIADQAAQIHHVGEEARAMRDAFRREVEEMHATHTAALEEQRAALIATHAAQREMTLAESQKAHAALVESVDELHARHHGALEHARTEAANEISRLRAEEESFARSRQAALDQIAESSQRQLNLIDTAAAESADGVDQPQAATLVAQRTQVDAGHAALADERVRFTQLQTESQLAALEATRMIDAKRVELEAEHRRRVSIEMERLRTAELAQRAQLAAELARVEDARAEQEAAYRAKLRLLESDAASKLAIELERIRDSDARQRAEAAKKADELQAHHASELRALEQKQHEFACRVRDEEARLAELQRTNEAERNQQIEKERQQLELERQRFATIQEAASEAARQEEQQLATRAARLAAEQLAAADAMRAEEERLSLERARLADERRAVEAEFSLDRARLDSDRVDGAALVRAEQDRLRAEHAEREEAILARVRALEEERRTRFEADQKHAHEEEEQRKEEESRIKQLHQDALNEIEAQRIDFDRQVRIAEDARRSLEERHAEQARYAAFALQRAEERAESLLEEKQRLTNELQSARAASSTHTADLADKESHLASEYARIQVELDAARRAASSSKFESDRLESERIALLSERQSLNHDLLLQRSKFEQEMLERTSKLEYDRMEIERDWKNEKAEFEKCAEERSKELVQRDKEIRQMKEAMDEERERLRRSLEEREKEAIEAAIAREEAETAKQALREEIQRRMRVESSSSSSTSHSIRSPPAATIPVFAKDLTSPSSAAAAGSASSSSPLASELFSPPNRHAAHLQLSARARALASAHSLNRSKAWLSSSPHPTQFILTPAATARAASPTKETQIESDPRIRAAQLAAKKKAWREQQTMRDKQQQQQQQQHHSISKATSSGRSRTTITHTNMNQQAVHVSNKIGKNVGTKPNNKLNSADTHEGAQTPPVMSRTLVPTREGQEDIETDDATMKPEDIEFDTNGTSNLRIHVSDDDDEEDEDEDDDDDIVVGSSLSVHLADPTNVSSRLPPTASTIASGSGVPASSPIDTLASRVGRTDECSSPTAHTETMTSHAAHEYGTPTRARTPSGLRKVSPQPPSRSPFTTPFSRFKSDKSLTVPVPSRKLTAHCMDSDDDDVVVVDVGVGVRCLVVAPSIGATDDESAITFPTEEELAALFAVEEAVGGDEIEIEQNNQQQQQLERNDDLYKFASRKHSRSHSHSNSGSHSQSHSRSHSRPHSARGLRSSSSHLPSVSLSVPPLLDVDDESVGGVGVDHPPASSELDGEDLPTARAKRRQRMRRRSMSMRGGGGGMTTASTSPNGGRIHTMAEDDEDEEEHHHPHQALSMPSTSRSTLEGILAAAPTSHTDPLPLRSLTSSAPLDVSTDERRESSSTSDNIAMVASELVAAATITPTTEVKLVPESIEPIRPSRPSHSHSLSVSVNSFSSPPSVSRSSYDRRSASTGGLHSSSTGHAVHFGDSDFPVETDSATPGKQQQHHQRTQSQVTTSTATITTPTTIIQQPKSNTSMMIQTTPNPSISEPLPSDKAPLVKGVSSNPSKVVLVSPPSSAVRAESLVILKKPPSKKIIPTSTASSSAAASSKPLSMAEAKARIAALKMAGANQPIKTVKKQPLSSSNSSRVTHAANATGSKTNANNATTIGSTTTNRQINQNKPSAVQPTNKAVRVDAPRVAPADAPAAAAPAAASVAQPPAPSPPTVPPSAPIPSPPPAAVAPPVASSSSCGECTRQQRKRDGEKASRIVMPHAAGCTAAAAPP